jgi:transcription antitermination factor NusG
VSQWDSMGGSLDKSWTGVSMYLEERRDSMPYPWFALRVKSRSEKIVATIARNKGFEEFLPLYQSRRRWSDRFKSVELPLFPGYVFCRLNPEFRLPLLTIPGVLSFVGIGRVPVPIEDTEIAAIQTAIGAGLLAEPYPFLEVGQRVRLAEGPLAGLEGLLVEVRKQQRIAVSVSLLKRSVAVEIDRQWVRPLDAGGRELSVQIRPALAAHAASCI